MAYEPPQLAGYNASPPLDDGSHVGSNALRWSTHLSKIGNPLKSYADQIAGNTELLFVGDVRKHGAAGDGVTDDTEAFQATADAVAAGGTFRVPAGHWIITNEIDFGESSDITIEIEAGAVIDCSSVAASSTAAIFNIGSVNEGQTTTITAAIDRGDTSLTVASSTGFSAGDMCALVSDDEYWGGVTGTSGFGRKTKGELVFIQQVPDATHVTLETAADESYSISGFTVTLIKLPKIENINIRCDGKFLGDGGGTDHTGSNPTGMRAVRVKSASNVEISGATFENFPRFAVEFHLCSSVTAYGNTVIGRKLDDPTNIPDISEWFTGFSFFGCNGVSFVNNTGRFVRRHYDADSIAVSAGMVIGRSHVVDSNQAISCIDVFGSHAVRNVTFCNNKGRTCYRGAGFRGRDVTMIGNDLGVIPTDTAIAIGGSTNSAYSASESPNVGHVVLIGNTGETGGRGIQISDDLDSLKSNGNNIVCGTTAAATIGIGYFIRGKRVRNVNIGSEDVIDLTNRADNAVGFLIPNSNNTCLVIDNVSFRGTVIGAYKAVSISGTGTQALPAEHIHIDCRVVDAEAAAVSFTASAFTGDGDGFFGDDVYARVVYSGSEPADRLEMPVAANIIKFRRRPAFEFDKARRFIGYGDPTDLLNGETVSLGDYMYDPDDFTEHYFSASGTAGDDGGATITINSGQTAGTITASGDLLAAGQYVRITGAGPASGNLDTRILSKSVNDIEFENAAGTSVVDAALSFRNPTSVQTAAPA